jgi:hypothetical protein
MSYSNRNLIFENDILVDISVAQGNSNGVLGGADVETVVKFVQDQRLIQTALDPASVGG